MLGSWYHAYDNVIIILIIPELFLIFLRLSAIFMGTYGTWRRSCTACHPTLELSKATLSGLVTEPERMAMVVNQAVRFQLQWTTDCEDPTNPEGTE